MKITILIIVLLLIPYICKGDITIRQEKVEKNGIVVYQPVSLDMRILDIIVTNNIRTPKEYVKWLNKNIVYKDDKIEYWQFPEETLKLKSGDCEDFAFLNRAFLRVMGYSPKVLALRIREIGHAVCIFKENGYYSYITNTSLKKAKAETMEELLEYLKEKWKCSYVLVLGERKK